MLICCSFRNSDPLVPVVIRIKSEAYRADHLGNVYTVNEDELTKFLPNGKMAGRYSNLRLGSISHLDVSNPLKILVYYRDFQQIVFLDNQLSVNSNAVSLEEMGYEQAELVCASANNSFWVYDKQNNELLRFDENSKKIAATGNLKQVLQSEITPVYMVEYNNYLFLNSPQHGIYVFDMFGAFSKVVSIKGLRDFQLMENVIYYQRDSMLCSYNHKLFEEACVSPGLVPVSAHLQYQNKKLYTGNKDSIVCRSFTPQATNSKSE